MPLIVIAICLGVLGAAVQMAAHGQSTTVEGFWLLVRFAALLATVILMSVAAGRGKPSRFVLTRNGCGEPVARR
ncbi:hypothetical protein [Allorhizocola rhizosphaerae]|uniref:hypothetical protein n=1 Tax=Allorhizocola rhizosphaerae TaxID=1872709 RepID=UPI0013C2ADD7|nr:hypothetical protein [Allorhizocola rhizosphaerae]